MCLDNIQRSYNLMMVITQEQHSHRHSQGGAEGQWQAWKDLENRRSPMNPLAQAIHKYDEMVDASISSSILQDSKHLPHCNHALTLYNLQQKLKNRHEGLEYLPLRSWDWWTTPVAEALNDQSPRLLHTHQSQKIWSMHHIPYFQNIFDFSWASHNKYITCKDRTFPHLLSSIHLTLTVVRPRHAWEFKEITRLSWSARDVLTGKFRAGKLP